MQALILAAGKAKRLQDVTAGETPKALCLVDGRPLVAHTLQNFPDVITEILFVIAEGPLGQQMLWTFGAEVLGRPVRYVIQKHPCGTGHAVQCAARFLTDDEPFLLVMGDDMYGPEGLRRLVRHPAAALVHDTPHPERSGIFEVGADGCVINVTEKPSADQIQRYLAVHPELGGRKEKIPVATGAYVLPKRIAEIGIPPSERGEYELTTAVQLLTEEGVKVTVVESDFWLPVNTKEELVAAETALRRRTSV